MPCVLKSNHVLIQFVKALVCAIFKRIKGFIKLKLALNMLDEALPDATKEELHSYNDDCNICRVSLIFLSFSMM